MGLPSKHFYDFGRFRVDARDHLLLRDGHVVPLPAKTFDLLLTMVQSGGRVLQKEELMKTLWPDTLTFGFSYRTPRWTPDGRSIVFPKTENHVINLWQPVAGGEPKPLTKFSDDVIFNYAFARDGRNLILSRGHSNVNVVLIRDFR